MSRFCVLANSGGAVAVLSFIGTTAADGHPVKIAIIPLALFAFGILFAGLSHFAIVMIARDQEAKVINIELVLPGFLDTELSKLKDRLGALFKQSFVCLFLGITVGLIMILLV